MEWHQSGHLPSPVEDGGRDTCEWLQQVCLVSSSHESPKLRRLPATSATTSRNHKRLTAVSLNSSLVCLIDNYENRLEICKLDLDPVPRLQMLCFLELPPLAPDRSHHLSETYKEWVPTSKSYVRTKSSRVHHLPFYTSTIGTIALRLEGEHSIHALIISVAALVSAIPTDLRNVPWEDWGPSCTHMFKTAIPQLTSLGPFWITHDPFVVRQYDLRRMGYTRPMAEDKSSLQSRPPVVDSTNIFQCDIETHLSYRDVMIQNEDLYKSSYIVADREWVVGVVCGFFVHISKIFRHKSNHSHRQDAERSVTVYHVG